MKKVLLKFSFYTLLSLLIVSCGSKKKITSNVSVQNKLEIEFQKYKGTPYKYGGITKRGFDCSGFVNTVYLNAFKIQLPRVTHDMAKYGYSVKEAKLKIGDLVFFKPSRKYMHVGIYVGNGQFMHSSTSKGVIKSRLDNVYWSKKYRFARRILKN